MKTMHRAGWRAVAGVAGLVAALAAFAADLAPPALAPVLEQAWRLHPEAAALDARDAELRAEREVAASLLPEPPSLSLGSRNDRANANAGKQEWEVELAAPLWLPGQQAAREAEAARRTDAAAARRAALRLELAGELREVWWALADARNAHALAQRRADTARALDGDVARRYRAGELSRIDTNLAQAETRAAQAESIEAEAALLQAEQAYRALTGAAAPAVLAEEAPAPRPGGAGAAATSDAADHPLLAAAAADAAAARARVRLAAESTRAAPELAVRAVRERGVFNEPYANTIGIRLKIPFSAPAQVRRETSAAQAEADRADAEMQRARTRVGLDAERARRALAAAQRQLAMAQERLELSAETLRLSEKAFALGESDLATLLRIRAAAFDTEAFLDRQRVARAAAISRLNQAQGVLP